MENTAQWDESVAIWRQISELENVRPSLSGVLTIHARQAQIFALEDTRQDHSHSTNYYTVVKVRQFAKSTRATIEKMGRLEFNSLLHFPVVVPRGPKHPNNYVKMELRKLKTDGKNQQVVIGSVSFHLHDIIQASPAQKTVYLWDENSKIGTIDLGISFTYGTFGYGHSGQLKESTVSVQELVQFSSFPRILPEEFDAEETEVFLNTRPIPHPHFIDFKEKAVFPVSKEMEQILPLIEQSMYQPKTIPQTSQIRDKYYSFKDRISRLQYLQAYLKSSVQQDEIVVDSTRQISNTADHIGNALLTSLDQYLKSIPTLNNQNGIIKSAVMDDEPRKGFLGIFSPSPSRKVAPE